MKIKRLQLLSVLCLVLAWFLSCAMCAVVAYNYCALKWGGQYAGWSAPPDVAFLLVIPYFLGILVCFAAFFVLRFKIRKCRESHVMTGMDVLVETRES